MQSQLLVQSLSGGGGAPTVTRQFLRMVGDDSLQYFGVRFDKRCSCIRLFYLLHIDLFYVILGLRLNITC